jgi:uncharacterized membrane protein YraQ (UPF0718 family)
MKLQDYLMLGGVLAILLVNPLLGQYIIQLIVLAYEQLLLVSDYFMVAGITAILIGYFISQRDKKAKSAKKLKSLKQKKTQSAGNYLDL